MAEPTSVDDLQPGTVIPTHGRSMKEQKAWFLEKAKKFRAEQAQLLRDVAEKEAKEAAVQEAAMKATAMKEPEIRVKRSDASPAQPAPQTLEPESVRSSAAPEAAVTTPAGAVDVTDTGAASENGLSEGLQALSLAGGDLATLAALAAGESQSTELQMALKGFGFKGLATRKKLETELKAFHATAVK